MAMLAEPRKKTKYRLQPFSGFSKINKRCDDDTNSFGFRMMSSMGWAPGKGLGANETGEVDPIKLRLKNDPAGIGYKVNEKEDALQQQSAFQALLRQLNSDTDKEDFSSNKLDKSKKPKINSLEKLSEQSTVRVHYKKFARGKDLSQASDRDLKSILGLSLIDSSVQDSKPELEPEAEPELSKPSESNSDHYISRGSSVDYFLKKFEKLKGEKKKKIVSDENHVQTQVSEEVNAVSSFDKSRRKSVTWGENEISFVDKYIKDMTDTSGSGDDALLMTECVEDVEVPLKKKKKKNKNAGENCDVATGEVLEAACQEKGNKKKKKNLLEQETYIDNIFEEISKVNVGKVEKNKKGKKRKHLEEGSCKRIIQVEESITEHLAEEEMSRKKKKRKQLEENNVATTEYNVKEEVMKLSVNSLSKKKKKSLEETKQESEAAIDNCEFSWNEQAISKEENNSNFKSMEQHKQKKKKKKDKVDQSEQSDL